MENNKLFIPVILGTARKDRQSEKAAKYVLEETKKAGIDTELVDVRDHVTGETIPAWVDDERTTKWRELVSRADGFIIVVPEYNHGYPGELKMLLDMAYKEYNRKPVGLCGVAGGGLGGARVVENIRPILVEFELVSTRNAVYFSNVGELFNEQGEIQDESYGERMETFFEELLWYAQALKVAREKA